VSALTEPECIDDEARPGFFRFESGGLLSGERQLLGPFRERDRARTFCADERVEAWRRDRVLGFLVPAEPHALSGERRAFAFAVLAEVRVDRVGR
jgi:hypothetical protein